MKILIRLTLRSTADRSLLSGTLKHSIVPISFPVLGPNGCEVTRGETSEISKDHVHHRSLYVAYGEVNDVDLWGEGSNCGKVVHQNFTQKHGGAPFLVESMQTIHGKQKTVKS